MLIDTPDKVAVVSGNGSCLAFECTKFLLRSGVRVYFVKDDAYQGRIEVELLNSLPYRGRAIFVQGNLAYNCSTEKAASDILSKEKQVSQSHKRSVQREKTFH